MRRADSGAPEDRTETSRRHSKVTGHEISVLGGVCDARRDSRRCGGRSPEATTGILGAKIPLMTALPPCLQSVDQMLPAVRRCADCRWGGGCAVACRGGHAATAARLPPDDRPGAGACGDLPLLGASIGTETTHTALQPGIEQVSERITEHIQTVDHHRQGEARPDGQPWRQLHEPAPVVAQHPSPAWRHSGEGRNRGSSAKPRP